MNTNISFNTENENSREYKSSFPDVLPGRFSFFYVSDLSVIASIDPYRTNSGHNIKIWRGGMIAMRHPQKDQMSGKLVVTCNRKAFNN